MSRLPDPLRHLVVPLDGSARAERGLTTAGAYAAALGADVIVVGVDSAPVDDTMGDRLAERARAIDIDAEVDVVMDDDTAGAIVETASSRNGVLVLATDGHGHGSHALLGSVATAVLRRSTRPVLLVGPRAVAAVAPAHVVACLDGSPTSEGALDPARQLAAGFGADLTLVQVLDRGEAAPSDVPETAYLDHHATRLGPDVSYEALGGSSAANAIASWVDGDPATLLVAGMHGRSGLSQLVLGSVVAGLVTTAQSPVLVVPATGG